MFGLLIKVTATQVEWLKISRQFVELIQQPKYKSTTALNLSSRVTNVIGLHGLREFNIKMFLLLSLNLPWDPIVPAILKTCNKPF